MVLEYHCQQLLQVYKLSYKSPVYVHVLSCPQDGLSPLYVASQEDHTDVVDCLLENGADPNVAWSHGMVILARHSTTVSTIV